MQKKCEWFLGGLYTIYSKGRGVWWGKKYKTGKSLKRNKVKKAILEGKKVKMGIPCMR